MRSDRVEIYKATDGWRFRYVRLNGRIMASGEAYSSRYRCEAAVAYLFAARARIVVVDS